MSEARELLVEVTILAVLFCCYTVCYYITNLLVWILSTWVDLLSNRPTFEWGGPGFLKYTHPLL